MVNCAHPLHIEPTLRRARDRRESWLSRFSGFRANASRKTHEELDNSTELDRGCPEALAMQICHLQEAEGFNDPGRAATARAEMDMLVAELSKGLGLSGRGRKFSTNAERARVNVQRRIRDAIRRIGELDEALARHLDRCIRTGTHCSYDPE